LREDKVSYSHTQRRKTVKRFKEKFGEKNWYVGYGRFAEYTARIVSEMAGPPIGTLEDIMNEAREAGKWLNPRRRQPVNLSPR
jgi:hypothetical protein